MNHFPDKKEREIVFANPQKKEPEIIAKPEPPSPRIVARPGDREPTTYHQLADRPDDFDQRVTNAIPRITSGPWAADPVTPEPPLGYRIDDVGPDSGGGASPKRRP